MTKGLFGSRRRAIGLAIVLSAPLPIPQAFAQGLEEIIVTARKKEENLFEAPLSVTSLSGAELERANIRDIQELQKYTPGLYYTPQASTSTLRIAPAMRFRGMNNSYADPLLQTGGAFIDGVFLFAGVQSLTMDDVERVEVIKGPQSALFGRSTFGGAVNFITKRPNADHFVERVNIGVETRGTYDLMGSVEGPIMKDKLMFRFSGGRNVKGSHWKTTDGGSLGYESTNVINSQFIFKPTDNLELRVRRMDNWQSDSRGFTVNMNASVPGLVNAKNRCQLAASPYWCGQLPLVGDPGVPFSALSVFTRLNSDAFNRTAYPNALIAILNQDRSLFPGVVRGLPYQNQVPHLDHQGSEGRYERTQIEAIYDLPNDWTFSAAYVSSKLANMSASTTSDDAGNQLGISPNILTDGSVDTRLSGDPNGRFTWSVGANYYLQTEVGGNGGTGATISTSDITRAITYAEPTAFINQTRNQYYGVFGQVHFSVTDQLGIDVEGRWSSDRVTNQYQQPTQAYANFKSFVPRTILTYKPRQDMTIYASWGRGILPGNTNSAVPQWSAALQAQARAVPGFQVDVPPERIDNFELGLKRQSNVFRYALTGYHMKWSNMKNQVSFNCPGAICGPNLPGSMVILFIPQPVKIYGVEVEVGWAITDHWDVNGSLELLHGRYERYVKPSAVAAIGTQIADGKVIQGTPQTQGVVGSTYRDHLSGDWDWYVRGNATYTGRIYVDEINNAWIGSAIKLSAHLGVEKNGMRFDVYGDNLTNNKQWQGAVYGTQNNNHLAAIATPQPSAIVTLPRLRTFGIRATMQFD